MLDEYAEHNPALTPPDLHHMDKSCFLPLSVFHMSKMFFGTSSRPVVPLGVQTLRTFSNSALDMDLGCMINGAPTGFASSGAGGSTAESWSARLPPAEGTLANTAGRKFGEGVQHILPSGNLYCLRHLIAVLERQLSTHYSDVNIAHTHIP